MHAAGGADASARAAGDAAARSERNTARASGAYAVAYAAALRDVRQDAIAIDEYNATPTDLAERPLSSDGELKWARECFTQLRNALLELAEDWDVWTEWYEARRKGVPSDEALEVARVMIANEIWAQGPKAVNAEIKRLIEEHMRTPLESENAKGFDVLELFARSLIKETWDQQHREPPTIPAPRPAAIEPVWVKGRLTVPKKPTKADLSKKKFDAALSALRAELRELVGDISAEANLDKRPAQFLRRLAERIPETMPQHDELFRLGHTEAVFAGYATTVDQEWPDFLASRYHAVALQFDRTLRQVPLWREFKRNAAKETLSPSQVEDSTSLAREAASALQQDEAVSFVDPAVPHALEQLADALPVAKANNAPPPDVIEAGKALLAADLVESVNNTLKPIAEVALASASEYAEEFGKSFKKAAKKQGRIDGEKALKWLRRLAIGGGAGGGSFVALSNLIFKFPEAFGWLERVLHVLK